METRRSGSTVVARIVIFGLVVGLGIGSASAALLFLNPRFNVGDAPRSVAIGDFDGDGRQDLVVANQGSYPSYISEVSVLLGKGDGSFTEQTRYLAGDGPSSIAIGDFDDDGRQDLVVTNSRSDDVSVLPGNGDGSFGAQTRYPAGDGPASVAIGDFDGDGRQDLVVANEGSYPSYGSEVSVLVGNGDGSFGAPTRYPAGDHPTSIAIGDFDGDGRQDLAVTFATSGTPPYFFGGLSVLLGNGDGSFATPTRYTLGASPWSVASGDFDGDGRQDLAVTNLSSGLSGLSVLLGNGDGSFAPETRYEVNQNPYSIAIGDLDGDGRQDLVVTSAATWPPLEFLDEVSVLLGNGDGSFGPEARYPVGEEPVDVAIGDFDRDGRQDLAVLLLGEVSVLVGDGTGGFPTPTRYPAGDEPESVAIGDLDGDGRQDLVVAGWKFNHVSVLLGNGDGGFGPEARYPTRSAPRSIAIGDLDGDGRRDLAVANSGTDDVSVLLGNGDGSFAAQIRYVAGQAPWSVVIGDFDGDGRQDLAVANSGTDDVSVLLGNGDGSFAAQTRYPVGVSPKAIAIGDFDGDGRQDLVVANNRSDDVSVLLGNGDGSFATPTGYPAGDRPWSIAIGDFDEDGRQDLAVGLRFGAPPSYIGEVSVLLGNGDGSFATPTGYPAGVVPVSIAIGDFDGDGRQDLAVANVGTSVSVLLGNGDGNFTTPMSYAAGDGVSSVAVADFDDDGRPDLAVTNVWSNDVAVLLNQLPRVVEIDIKPNAIHPYRRGVVPVVLFGSEEVEISDIDVTTLRFGPDKSTTRHDLADPWTYGAHARDVNLDGFVDLMMHFEARDTGIDCGRTEAGISGALLDGTPFEGSDGFETVGCRSNRRRPHAIRSPR